MAEKVFNLERAFLYWGRSVGKASFEFCPNLPLKPFIDNDVTKRNSEVYGKKEDWNDCGDPHIKHEGATSKAIGEEGTMPKDVYTLSANELRQLQMTLLDMLVAVDCICKIIFDTASLQALCLVRCGIKGLFLGMMTWISQ
ncbi:hypothetical protein LJC27_04225 [Christensenellaceae bacterium OttesenSCG-928-M15]|nr:hypothetical protein [Christensenellaceae bacterium OttesenSCG-928-M15]